jgi:hypothetical protein
MVIELAVDGCGEDMHVRVRLAQGATPSGQVSKQTNLIDFGFSALMRSMAAMAELPVASMGRPPPRRAPACPWAS